MICYRDMTFCSGEGCAKFGPCPRSLTEQVKADAEAAGLNISRFTEPRHLDCWQAERETSDEDGASLL